MAVQQTKIIQLKTCELRQWTPNAGIDPTQYKICDLILKMNIGMAKSQRLVLIQTMNNGKVELESCFISDNEYWDGKELETRFNSDNE